MPAADANLRDQLADLVARCVLLFEAAGETAVAAELAAQPEMAAAAREQFEMLRASGLLVLPEQPEQIGPYRVLQRLGGGGMGWVYLCEQDAPIRRRVAVKVIRPGMDTHEVLARFQVERQALALLEHQSVAKVLDAGCTASGRPYLVMEYVPGVPVTQYCDSRQLDTAARLLLFTRICDAVQHAHHKGILHRDLKPSNLLVFDRDGAPFPVVIDFGVAKAVSGALRGATLLTLPGRMLGTREYMSPEQATNDQDVDTRTDVYSLGVVLYQLLTGTLPIDSRQLLGKRDVAQLLSEIEPPPPSSRITALQDGGEAAAALRGSDPISLRRALRGDLDWIVMQALAKDRNRRYGMPAELAADVRRHLADEAVSASPPRTWYRFQKYVRRHRLQVVSAALVFVALTGGLSASLAFYQEAVAAERQVQGSASRLHQSLETSLTALDRIVGLGVEGLRALPNGDELRRGLLRTALDLHDRLIGIGGQGDVRLSSSLALTLARAARLHLMLGETADARELLQRGEQVLAGMPMAMLSRPDLLPYSAQTCHLFGELRNSLGAPEVAKPHDALALRLYSEWLQRDPAARAARLGRLQALRALSDRQTGTTPVAARELLQQALPLAQEFLADPAAVHEELVASLRAMVRLGWIMVETGASEGREIYESTRQQTHAVLARTRTLPEQLDLVPVLDQLVSIGMRRQQFAALRPDLAAEIAMLRQAVVLMPGEAVHRGFLATALFHETLLLDDERPPAVNDAQEREALQLEEDYFRLLGSNPERGDRLISCLISYGGKRVDWLESGGSYGDAVDIEFVRKVLARADEVHAMLPANYLQDRHCRESWTQSFRVRAMLLVHDGDGRAALRELLSGVEFAARLVQDHPGVLQTRLILAELRAASAQQQAELGDVDDSLRSYCEAAEELFAARDGFDQTAAFWSRGRRVLMPWLRQLGAKDAAGVHGGNAQQQVAAAALAARCAEAAGAAAPADREQAVLAGICLLRSARESGFADLQRLATDARFAALRQHPEFATLAR